MAAFALVTSALAALAALGSFVVSQRSIKHVRRQAGAAEKQAELALDQLRLLRSPAWGEPQLEDRSERSFLIRIPLVSDTPLDCAVLDVLVPHGQRAGLYLEGAPQGAPSGLRIGEQAVWQLALDPEGEPTTEVRLTATRGSDQWHSVIQLPFSAGNWRDVMVL